MTNPRAEAPSVGPSVDPLGAPQEELVRTVVHLLRHGEVHNPDHVLYGRLPDFHLSELGRAMAVLAAEHLADHDIVHIVASPLERAVETATPLAEQFGLPITRDPRVIEADSAFEGMPVAGGSGLLSFLAANPHMIRKLLNPFRPSWGEPYKDIVWRMRDAILAARDAAHGHEAVIVSHQAPIWMIRIASEGRSLVHNPGNRECSLASLTSFTFLGAEILSVSYSEPAAALLPQAQSGAGA